MPSARPPQDTKEWMPAPPALVRAFDGAVQSVRGAEGRKMFGYPAVFVNGNMFAGLVRDRMILRLGDRDRERFLAIPGATPFVAMGGRPMRAWVVVPPAMVESLRDLAPWLRRAARHGRSLPPKGPRRAGRR